MHIASGGGPNCDPRLSPGGHVGHPGWQIGATTFHVFAGVHHPTTPPAPQLRVHLHRRPGIEHALSAPGSAAGQSPSVGPTPGIVFVGCVMGLTFVVGVPASRTPLVAPGFVAGAVVLPLPLLLIVVAPELGAVPPLPPPLVEDLVPPSTS
jgi:hypothetical protein